MARQPQPSSPEPRSRAPLRHTSGRTHCPAASEHTGRGPQPLTGWQTTGAPSQAPLRQASPSVQARPSSQGAPLGRGGTSHAPVSGAQAPRPPHWASPVSQTFGVPTHAPARQVSPSVHRSASSQATPSASATSAQAPLVASQNVR